MNVKYCHRDQKSGKGSLKKFMPKMENSIIQCFRLWKNAGPMELKGVMHSLACLSSTKFPFSPPLNLAPIWASLSPLSRSRGLPIIKVAHPLRFPIWYVCGMVEECRTNGVKRGHAFFGMPK